MRVAAGIIACNEIANDVLDRGKSLDLELRHQQNSRPEQLGQPDAEKRGRLNGISEVALVTQNVLLRF